MSLYKYFQRKDLYLLLKSFSSRSSRGIVGKKRKAYISFTEEDRARIGQYAAENGNNAALKKFKPQFPDLGESTSYEALKRIN